MNTNSSLPHASSTPFFLKGGMKFPKNWVGGAILKKFVWETKRGKAEKMQRS